MLENKDACMSSVTSLDIQALNFHNLDFWDGGIMCISGTESDSHRQLQIKCPSKYANENIFVVWLSWYVMGRLALIFVKYIIWIVL